MSLNNYLVSFLKWTTRHLGPAMLLLWLMITVFVPGAAAQDDDSPTLTVVAPVLSVRTGPGMIYEVIDYLLQDEQISVIGYDAASNWWQVELPNSQSGWVSGRPYYVSVSGDTSEFFEPTPAQQIEPTAADKPQSGTIVFQTTSGGNIYAINVDGTNLRYLTTGMDPAISPDGQWVAFTRWETSQDGALGNVWVINVDGAGERVIHEYVRNPRSPTWSADGRQIVIGMQHGGQVGELYKCGSERPPRNAYNVSIHRGDNGKIRFCYTLPPDPHWGLRIVDLVTGAYEDLPSKTYSFSPALNPADDQYLIYDGDDELAGDEGLTGLNLEANLTWDVTTDVNDHSPVFSPDGSKIAVSYRQHDHWEIHVMNADGSNRQRLTATSYITLVEQLLRGEESHSFNNAAPAWSPDGSQIAFLTDRTGQWEIWVMNADGSNQHPLFDAAVQTQLATELGLQYNGVDERMLSWGP